LENSLDLNVTDELLPLWFEFEVSKPELLEPRLDREELPLALLVFVLEMDVSSPELLVFTVVVVVDPVGGVPAMG
jgi:hypothetical protein